MEEAAALDLASRLASGDWQPGRARTGRATAEKKANLEILAASEADPFWPDVAGISEAILDHGGLISRTLMTKITVPKFNRYVPGGEYRRHFDASPMGRHDMRTDYACTLFLTPPEAYDGGDLTVETRDGIVLQAPRCGPGEAVAYECGNAHWVTPVTRGERVSAILWARSMVQDPAKRSCIVKLGEILHRAEREGKAIEPFGDDHTTLTGIHTAMLQMWSDA